MRARFGSDEFVDATSVTLYPGEQVEVQETLTKRPRKAWLAWTDPSDQLQPRVLSAILDDDLLMTCVLAHPNPDATAQDPPVIATAVYTQPDPSAGEQRGSIE